MKQRIRYIENKGRYIKPCPGTPRHVCCGYQIIDFAHGCTLGCTYCALNVYSYSGTLTVFNNREKLFSELDRFLKETKGIVRFGTGEFTDSLLFEEEYPLYPDLIPRISGTTNAVLEIKTKTVCIQPLMCIQERDNIIVSWSLNSEYIAENEERYAPGIEERIDAAARVQDAGYKLAFHFDPIIPHHNWESEYRRSVDLLFKKIHPENVVYMSLGTLRFSPAMAGFLDHTSEEVRRGEFISGADKKMRYFRPIRTNVYRVLKDAIEKYMDEKHLYLCMESPTVWEDVFGIKHMTLHRLKKRLDDACIQKFSRLSSDKIRRENISHFHLEKND